MEAYSEVEAASILSAKPPGKSKPCVYVCASAARTGIKVGADYYLHVCWWELGYVREGVHRPIAHLFPRRDVAHLLSGNIHRDKRIKVEVMH